MPELAFSRFSLASPLMGVEGGGREGREEERERERVLVPRGRKQHLNFSPDSITCSVGTVSPPSDHRPSGFSPELRGTAPSPCGALGFPPGSAWSPELASHTGGGADRVQWV